MPRAGDTDSAGRIFIPAPYPSMDVGSGQIQGVWLWNNEEVEWNWVHAPTGSYVSGYSIKQIGKSK